MKYFGKPVEIVRRRKLEYITCDCCNRKIAIREVYYHLYYSNRYYGNCETTYNEDLCKECIGKRADELIKQMEDVNTRLYIDGEIHWENSMEEYDEDKHKLIDGETDND